MNRNLARAARQFADANTGRFNDMKLARLFLATVASVTAGGAADGIAALVTVTWRGQVQTASAYASSYTPTVADRVLCVLIDNQLVIVGDLIGQP